MVSSASTPKVHFWRQFLYKWENSIRSLQVSRVAGQHRCTMEGAGRYEKILSIGLPVVEIRTKV